MAFLMSFPLMFRSKVGEMKFSIPQSLLAERGKGAQGVPATLTPSSTGQGRGTRQPRRAVTHPVASLAQIHCHRVGQVHFEAEWPFSYGFTEGNSQPSSATLPSPSRGWMHAPCFGDKIMTFQHVQFPGPKPWATCVAGEFTQPKH